MATEPGVPHTKKVINKPKCGEFVNIVQNHYGEIVNRSIFSPLFKVIFAHFCTSFPPFGEYRSDL